MERNKIITELQKYFKIEELVSPKVYETYGEANWRLFSTEILETALVLRCKILNVPLICNNWKGGGQLTQRGFRENISSIVWSKTNAGVLYMGAHTIGKGLDFSSGKMTADEMRAVIKAKQSLLPHKVRIELPKSAPTWLHIDTMTAPDQREKICWFA